MQEEFDLGPWHVVQQRDGSPVIWSEDFKHDVALRVTGDFADVAQKTQYCEWLVAKLNGKPVNSGEGR